MSNHRQAVLSKTQLGIYLECTNEPTYTNYNIPFLATLGPAMDTDRLKAAIEAALAAHPALNTTLFVAEDGQVMQKIVDGLCHVEVVHLSDEEFASRREHLVQPFTLLGGALCRFVIYITPTQRYLFEEFHHILVDGTGLQILVRDMQRAYDGEPLEPDTYTGLDVARDEAARESTPEYEQARRFYDALLQGRNGDCLPVPDVFEDTPRQGWLNYEFQLDAAAFKALRSELQVSTTGYFTAVMGFLVGKYNYKEESVIATVYDGRRLAQNKNVISMLVKTLPFVADFTGNVPVREFLKKSADTLMESRRHDLYSFAEIAENYEVKADINFAYQGHILDYQLLAVGDMQMERLYDENHIEQTPLLFELSDLGGGTYQLHVGYRADMFSRDFALYMARAYGKAAQELLVKDYVDDVELADEEAAARIDGFNATERAFDRSRTVIDLFREQVQRQPDHPALVYLDKRFTYGELDRITDILGRHLRRRGIGRETVTGVLIPRCEYMVICALGILKAGGAYLPMDPSYPPERLNLMLRDSGARLLITTDELEPLIGQEYTGARMKVDEIPALPDCDEPLPPPAPHDLFIMLYTSGSTGLPKGVMLEHGNLNAFCSWARHYYDMDENVRAAAYASYGFDANMFDTYPTLTAGGTVYIIDDGIRLNLLELQDYYNRNGITHSLITTQVGRQFALMEGTTTLRHLTVGGEKLVPLDPPPYALYNAYGPTETTILTTTMRVDKKYKDVPIGPALDNIKLYVVDKNGRLLPPGAVGELWISGWQVGRSYLNRPEQTAKAFTPNPFCDREGYDRVYHTGDVVRFMDNGCIQFVGRRDAQVKVRGFRIELTEVEEVIRRFPGIRDATVAAFDDPAGGKFLAAYVVADQPVSVEALNQFILDQKPPYMVPAVTMQIDKIPLNQNQKVNKRALPVPKRTFEDCTPPRNDTEQKIFDIVAQVIGADGFGVNTNLYLAGLTSVGAVRLNVLLSKAFDRTVQTRDLKENDTVEKLAAFLTQAPAETEDFAPRPDYALTKNQEGIFIDSVAHPGTTVYNIPLLLELSPAIDLSRLARALAAAVNAHPYIKTRLFADDAGEIRQRRNDDEPFGAQDIEVLDVAALDSVRDTLVRPFALLGDRLFRIRILRADKNYLFLEFHHIIADGTSLLVFFEDVGKAYAGQPLEAEIYSGYEAVLAEQRSRAGAYYEKAKDHYARLLAGCDPDCLPAGDLREQPVARSAEKEVFGRAATAADVKHYCEANQLSLNGFFTAMFGLVLSKFCGKEKPVFTTIYNGRSDSRLHRAMAMLVKTYPVVCDVSRAAADTPVAACIAAVGDQMLESMANDLYSFGEISRTYGVRPDVMFAYQGEDFTFDTLCGEPVTQISLALDQAKAPLNLNVFLQDGRIRYFCEYRSDRFSGDYIDSFLDACDKAVSELLTQPTVGKISVLSDRAAADLAHWNDTRGTVEPLPVPALLERQAALHPDKTAVTAGGVSLTFAQLNARANRIAHRLIDGGVGADVIVGLYLDRTVDVYAVRQGILKSGGAFLSTAPDYPDERIAYIFQNAKAPFVITTRALYESRRALFDSLDSRVLLLEDLYENGDDTNPGVTIDPASLAYCIYTSGSTGTPKGVMIEHRNLMNLLQYHDKNVLAHAYVDNTTVFLGLAAITFDVSIIEEMMPLCHGQSVAMATEEEIHNPILLAQMMEATGVDMMKCTPSYMQTMLEFPPCRQALARLRALIIGAEPFPENLYAQIRQAGFTGRLYNSYGPTETTVTVTIDELDGKTVTIGRPAGNTELCVLDWFDQPLPPYARGELTILGDSVGRGYVALPEQTRQKFIAFAGHKAYRSGDIAYWNRDGKIVHCGRSDNQIKLRGLRVELDEIENVMDRFEGITRSVVIVRGEGNDQYLCGYYVAAQPVDHTALAAFLGKTLAAYMVPAVFVHLDALPLTPNGKVDKRALPEPTATQTARPAGREPVTPLEHQLCDIFAKALGVDKVYADDDFFALGGTSLSASKVAMRCMTEKIPAVYSDIFDHTTPEKLAAFLAGRQAQAEPAPAAAPAGQSPLPEEAYHDVLQYNTAAFVEGIRPGTLGKVLVTGATGYLGIHVVRELLRTGCETVYCLVRKGHSQSVESRLKMMLMYYFDDAFDAEVGTRLLPVDGDITDPHLGDTLAGCDFDTVINCAACVKHFVADDLLDRINVQGVENLISLCRQRGKQLIQISTVSIAGESVDGSVPPEVKLTEDRLYLGQALDNKYTDTKFRAEKAMLEAIRGGLRGKIIRVGNLMSRQSDGEFQINYTTNGFMKRLRAYGIIGCFPVGSMDAEAEFSPIDCTARAVVLLAATPDKFTVFHAYNCHHVHMANVVAVMQEYGIPLQVVEDAEFHRAFDALLADETRNMDISPLIAYMNGGKANRCFIDSDNHFTVKALYQLGFAWPLTGEHYIRQAVQALFTLGFFGEKADG